MNSLSIAFLYILVFRLKHFIMSCICRYVLTLIDTFIMYLFFNDVEPRVRPSLQIGSIWVDNK